MTENSVDSVVRPSLCFTRRFVNLLQLFYYYFYFNVHPIDQCNVLLGGIYIGVLG